MTGHWRIAFFGSSVVSAYWNGAATYYRGIIEALHHLGHKITFHEPDAFNATPLAVLNVCRDSTARFGFSPPTRIFEAAGAGACAITDRWTELELFLTPGSECLAVDSGQAVAEALDTLTPDLARRIGAQARQRILAEHTCTQRARHVEQYPFTDNPAQSPGRLARTESLHRPSLWRHHTSESPLVLPSPPVRGHNPGKQQSALD